MVSLKPSKIVEWYNRWCLSYEVACRMPVLTTFSVAVLGGYLISRLIDSLRRNVQWIKYVHTCMWPCLGNKRTAETPQLIEIVCFT